MTATREITLREFHQWALEASHNLPDQCWIMNKERFTPEGLEESRLSIWHERNTKRLVGYIGDIQRRTFTPDDGATYGIVQELIDMGWTIQ
jgi:hypothetical protein